MNIMIRVQQESSLSVETEIIKADVNKREGKDGKSCMYFNK